MKKHIILSLLAINFFTLSKAQNLIAIHHNGIRTFEIILDSAISHSFNNDTIYLPSGSFSISKDINKKLSIIGVGYYPDSSNVSNTTNVFGNINLISGSDSGSLTGINIPNGVYFGNSSTSGCANNYSIYRCYLGTIESHAGAANYAPNNNLFIQNIVVSYLDFLGGNNNYFFNNILYSVHQTGNNGVFYNNIFLCSFRSICSASSTATISSSSFKNNIFLASSVFWGSPFNNNTFSNNLFVQNISFPYLSTNTGTNNIVNQTQSSIFINQSGEVFNYGHNYHLKSTCLGKNAGSDTMDIGIYGGLYPWKDGGVPANPHIIMQNISNTTDQNGNLLLNIKVKAQNN